MDLRMLLVTLVRLSRLSEDEGTRTIISPSNLLDSERPLQVYDGSVRRLRLTPRLLLCSVEAALIRHPFCRQDLVQKTVLRFILELRLKLIVYLRVIY